MRAPGEDVPSSPEAQAVDSGGDATPWSREASVMVCEAGGRLTLLVRESWSAIKLDQVSAYMWMLLQQPLSTAQLVEALVARYAVSATQCRAEILPVLIALREAGALTGGQETASTLT